VFRGKGMFVCVGGCVCVLLDYIMYPKVFTYIYNGHEYIMYISYIFLLHCLK